MRTTTTLSSLLSPACFVDIFLNPEEVATQFLIDATSEGFTIDKKITSHDHMWVCLRNDKTISYPRYVGFAACMAFHHCNVRNGRVVVKVDYEKLRNGNEDFIINHKEC